MMKIVSMKAKPQNIEWEVQVEFDRDCVIKSGDTITLMIPLATVWMREGIARIGERRKGERRSHENIL